MADSLTHTPVDQPDDNDALVRSGRRVIADEVAGLHALIDGLDDRFARTIRLLESVKGRIVVTGMGKSGHVARKLAATLASTGAPAQYVHPAEASHGDLGMITKDDAILALSNSGETPELSDLIAYVTLKGIPLVSICGRETSTLTKMSTFSLVIPDCREACPLNLAPTTSTTAMLALGDAIAVVLLERRGFSRDDFRLLHPGGQIGWHLIKVADIMHQEAEMPLVSGSSQMTETIIEMTGKRFGCAGVIEEDGRLVGIITDGDLRRHMRDDILAMTAADVMTRNPVTVEAGNLAAQALAIMNDAKITNIFVVQDSVPVGIVHIHDLLRSGIS